MQNLLTVRTFGIITVNLVESFAIATAHFESFVVPFAGFAKSMIHATSRTFGLGCGGGKRSIANFTNALDAILRIASSIIEYTLIATFGASERLAAPGNAAMADRTVERVFRRLLFED